ncbi:YtpI family protein [Metabacillus herbersteinensis]|uniref:YtpI family protein n=1 Tax=Metabacillus herbersteinensis TaxID=283816 RepID=A0ABV6G9D6_9BACI
MPIFVILIIFSLSFYLYYKVKFYRSRKPYEKQWISSKSSIALGVFVLFFGLNQLFMYRSTVSLVIGIVFVIVGIGSCWAGYRAFKHYSPLAIKEASEKN